MIVHMCKLRIVTLDEQFDQLIEGLQHLGYLHLEPVELEAPRRDTGLHRMQLTEQDERRRQVLAEAKRHLDELRVALGGFPEPAVSDTDAWKQRTPEEIRDAAAEMLHQVRSLRRRRRNLEQDRRVLQRYMRMSHLVPRLGPTEDETEVLLFTFPSEERLVARTLRDRLRGLEPRSPRLRLFRSAEGNTVAAVACLAGDAPQIRDLAWRAGTLEFKLPAAYRSDRLRESFRRVQSDLDAMPRHLSEMDGERDAYRREAGHWAAVLDRICAEESQRLEAKHNFIEGSLLRCPARVPSRRQARGSPSRRGRNDR